MTRGTALPKSLIFILTSLIFLAANAAVAQAQDARVEKEYKGTLTGSVQYHPENKRFPYWLKVENSTYGIVIGDNAESKALLDELMGTRMSLAGTIQELQDGGLVIVADLPLQRPAKHQAPTGWRFFFTNSTSAENNYSSIVEEILLGNGERVFLVGAHSNADEWCYKIYSSINGLSTFKENISGSRSHFFGSWWQWVTVFRDHDVLNISTPRISAGSGITETWIYEKGKLSEYQDTPDEARQRQRNEKPFNATLGGFLFTSRIAGSDLYWLKSGNSIYYFKRDFSKEQDVWLAECLGKWVVLSGQVYDVDDRPEITPDPPIQPQLAPAVSVSGTSVLYKGTPVFTATDAKSLFVQEELVMGSGEDVFLVGIETGHEDSPYLYKVISVRNSACAVTDVFGNGGRKLIVSPAGDDAVTVTFVRFNPGKGLTETWTYKDGKVSKAQTEAVIRRAAVPAPKTSQEPPKSVGLDFIPGAHPIDEARLECATSCGGTTICEEECRAKQLAAWEKEMTRAYRDRLAHAQTPQQKKTLRLAQEQWLKYKDAEVAHISAALSQETGTIWGIVYAGEVVKLYRNRAIELMCQAEMTCMACPGNANCRE